jgi:hypothetical protein
MACFKGLWFLSGVTAMNSSFSSSEKREKEGDLCGLPAPESEVFSAAPVGRERKEYQKSS